MIKTAILYNVSDVKEVLRSKIWTKSFTSCYLPLRAIFLLIPKKRLLSSIPSPIPKISSFFF